MPIGPGKQKVLIFSITSLTFIALLIRPDALAAQPVLTIGSAVAQPGGTASLSVSATGALTNVAGMTIYFEVVTESGMPPLIVSFRTGAQTSGWFAYTDPNDALHYTIANSVGISGPAELMKIDVTGPASTPYSTVYALNVRFASLSNDHGQERDITQLSGKGQIGTPVIYGDANRDGRVDITDALELIWILLGLKEPGEGDLRAGDVRPRPGTDNRPFGDGLISSDDVNWVLRHIVGLNTDPSLP